MNILGRFTYEEMHWHSCTNQTKALKGDAICIWCVLHTNIQLYTNASKYKICEFHTYNLNWNT